MFSRLPRVRVAGGGKLASLPAARLRLRGSDIDTIYLVSWIDCVPAVRMILVPSVASKIFGNMVFFLFPVSSYFLGGRYEYDMHYAFLGILVEYLGPCRPVGIFDRRVVFCICFPHI